MDRQNSIHFLRSPHHSNRKLEAWFNGIKKVMAFMKEKRGISLKYTQVFIIIEMFFDLAFKAQMRGYYKTWPAPTKRIELHILKYVGKPKGKKHFARLSFLYPDNYLGYEFVTEPAGERFVNYGYEYVPDYHVRKEIVRFINNNPEIAEKLMS